MPETATPPSSTDSSFADRMPAMGFLEHLRGTAQAADLLRPIHHRWIRRVLVLVGEDFLVHAAAHHGSSAPPRS